MYDTATGGSLANLESGSQLCKTTLDDRTCVNFLRGVTVATFGLASMESIGKENTQPSTTIFVRDFPCRCSSNLGTNRLLWNTLFVTSL